MVNRPPLTDRDGKPLTRAFKKIYCPTCGADLARVNFYIDGKAHIHKSENLITCDMCEKSQTVTFGRDEIHPLPVAESEGTKIMRGLRD